MFLDDLMDLGFGFGVDLARRSLGEVSFSGMSEKESSEEMALLWWEGDEGKTSSSGSEGMWPEVGEGGEGWKRLVRLDLRVFMASGDGDGEDEEVEVEVEVEVK